MVKPIRGGSPLPRIVVAVSLLAAVALVTAPATAQTLLQRPLPGTDTTIPGQPELQPPRRAPITLTPSIAAGVEYNDNVLLDNDAREWDVIGIFAPGLTFTAERPTWRVNAGYHFENRVYWREPSRNNAFDRQAFSLDSFYRVSPELTLSLDDVVIDGPPVLPVADTLPVAAEAIRGKIVRSLAVHQMELELAPRPRHAGLRIRNQVIEVHGARLDQRQEAENDRSRVAAGVRHEAGTVEMVEAIVRDKKRVIASAAYCEDEFGVAPGNKGGGYFVGVPVVLGAKGMEKVITLDLVSGEQKLMNESISHVKDLVGVVKKLFPDLA